MRLFLAFLLAAALIGGESLPRYAVREGLPHVAAKLAGGGSVTVAFLGGSITKGGGAAGFSAAIPRWLQERHPKTTVTAINAGINGTDSAFGAARTDRDLIAKKPDLVFVEFAVNDGTVDRSGDMERIVRKLWTADPACDVVFLYTVSEEQLASWKSGGLPRAAAAHERVAAFYGIPSIGLGVDLVAKLAEGATWKQLMRDGCHPTEAGYAVYAGQIREAVTAALAVGKPGRVLRGETLKPGLVLYPPPVAVQPMPAAEPLIAIDGRSATRTWVLPTAGEHWRQDPEFRVDGRALWALQVQPFKGRGGRIEAGFGLSRDAWMPMRWLEERGSFDGPEGLALYAGRSLAAREADLPVIAFIAPESGTYAFAITATKVRLWSHHQRLGLNLVHFPWGEATGRSLAFAATSVQERQPPALAGVVALAAGEILAACLDADASSGGGGATLEGFSIRVGLLP